MNPEIAMAVARQHHHDLAGETSRHSGRPSRQSGPGRRRRPRWHVSWTRVAPGEGAGHGRPRSSWVIIISPGRPG